MTKLDEIRQLELKLEELKQGVAADLRDARQAAKVSLTQVARTCRVSAPTVLEAEKGRAWNIRTITKLARYFEKRNGNANGQSASENPAP